MLVEEHNVGLRRFALIAAQWRFLWAVFRHRNSSKNSQRALCFYYSTEAKAEGPLPRKFLSPDLHGLVCTEQSTHQGNRWKMSVFSTLTAAFLRYLFTCIRSPWDTHLAAFSLIVIPTVGWRQGVPQLCISQCHFNAERFTKNRLFVSLSFQLPPAARLPISPLSTSLLHQLSYVCLTLVHRSAFGRVTDSQLQKIAGALKELLKAFCQHARGLKAESSLQHWWTFYLIG